MQASDYSVENLRIKEFEKALTNLLSVDTSQMHQKEKTFVNRLLKRRDAILTFLY